MANRKYMLAPLLALILPFGAGAETMELKYEFYGTEAQKDWARGAVIRMQFDGTVQADGDTVQINSIDSITLDRVGEASYTFPSVEAGEFGSIPAGGTPVVSFSGSTLNFTVCPSGFTTDTDGDTVPDNCDYELTGGFGMTYGLSAGDGDWASAAGDDGSGTCGQPGCPVTEPAIDVSVWLLDSDSDGDGIFDSQDNCPNAFNRGQRDSNRFADGDGIGDACEVGDMQSFSDNARPIRTPSFNAIPNSCAINGWLVFRLCWRCCRRRERPRGQRFAL